MEQEGAVILINKSARNFVEDNRAIIKNIEEVSGSEELLVKLNPVDSDWLVRTVLGFGGGISVKEPLELANDITSRVQAIQKVYLGK